jgi:uncharacterized protein (TIGR00255 family)
MAFSMTASGHSRISEDGYEISVWIRSVNHRFFQCLMRLPKGFQDWEKDLREIVGGIISRGKVDILVEFESLPAEALEIRIDRGLADNILKFARDFGAEQGIPGGLTVENLLRFPDVFRHIPRDEACDRAWEKCKNALNQALESFFEERSREGDKLTDFLVGICSGIQSGIVRMRSLAEKQVEEIRCRLILMLEKMALECTLDNQRIEQEIALISVRADITEELVRLDSHVSRFQELIIQKEAVGKKCEFLLQEMHREINTIGSKSCNTMLSEIVVDLKADIEKMREQIQNIE